MPILKVAPSPQLPEPCQSRNYDKSPIEPRLVIVKLLIMTHDFRLIDKHPTYTICPCRCAKQIRADELGIEVANHSEILFKYV